MPARVVTVPPGIFDMVIAMEEGGDRGTEELNGGNDPKGEASFQHGAALLRPPADVGARTRDLDIPQVGRPIISSPNTD